jgi:Asp/Glu/hydantoin racemase
VTTKLASTSGNPISFMKKKVAIIHTSLVALDKLKDLFGSILPEVKVYNIVDDSLLSEVMEHNQVTPGIVYRIKNHLLTAESLGVDAILSQCSSMGEAIDEAKTAIKTPVLKIDQAMAEMAVSMGSKITVVATVASTVRPSCNLIRNVASKLGKEIEIVEALVEGALDILINKGDKEKHNELVLQKIKSLEGKCDVIVLAQGSMVVLLPLLKNINTPVLTSPELAVKKIRDFLYQK